MHTGFGLVLVLLPFWMLTSGTNIFTALLTSSIVIGQVAMLLLLNNTLKFFTVDVQMIWYNLFACFDI